MGHQRSGSLSLRWAAGKPLPDGNAAPVSKPSTGMLIASTLLAFGCSRDEGGVLRFGRWAAKAGQ